MSSKEIGLGIVLYKDVVKDLNYLKSLIMSRDLNWKKAKVLSTSKNPNVDKNIRNTDIVKVPFYKNGPIKETTIKDKISNYTTLSLSNCLLDYYKRYKTHPESQYEYSLLRYEKGQKFDEHVDNYSSIPRSISLIYFLNDDYKGGEIDFPILGLNIKPIANSAIIFPSNYIYRHSIKEVISGTRYSIVTWLV